jgi:hypothetical protein
MVLSVVEAAIVAVFEWDSLSRGGFLCGEAVGRGRLIHWFAGADGDLGR